MSMQNPNLCLDISFGKLLLDTLKTKISYYNWIMVVYIQHVIFLKSRIYFLYC